MIYLYLYIHYIIISFKLIFQINVNYFCLSLIFFISDIEKMKRQGIMLSAMMSKTNKQAEDLVCEGKSLKKFKKSKNIGEGNKKDSPECKFKMKDIGLARLEEIQKRLEDDKPFFDQFPKVNNEPTLCFL